MVVGLNLLKQTKSYIFQGRMTWNVETLLPQINNVK